MAPHLRFALGLSILGLAGLLVLAPNIGLFRGVQADTQSGTTTLTAPIIQPGKDIAESSQARLAGRVQFRPARDRRPVIIQRLAEGGSWTDLTRVRQNADGVAQFKGAAYTSTGLPYSYRGVAVAWEGLDRVTSVPQSADEWQSIFVDEFTGAAMGPQWQDRVSESPSRQCAGVGDERARSVSGGTLELKVLVDPDREDQTCRSPSGRFKYYLNGQVSTAGSVAATRGFFAARIKFAQRRGQHGSFWLQPVTRQDIEGDPAASGAEIDIVEFFGKGYPQGGLASFLYNYGIEGGEEKIGGMAPKATAMLPRRDAWWKSYHVFSLEWTKSRYVFRVDGREHYRTSRGVSGVDEYLILSMLTSDWELQQAKRLGTEPGGTMKVDWVRVWQ